MVVLTYRVVVWNICRVHVSILLIQHEKDRNIPFTLQTRTGEHEILTSGYIKLPPPPGAIVTIFKNGTPVRIPLVDITNIRPTVQEADYSDFGPQQAVLDTLERLGKATARDVTQFLGMNGYKRKRRSIASTLSGLAKKKKITESEEVVEQSGEVMKHYELKQNPPK